ncbi:hypothetical protein ACT6NV_12355 [Robiginitalea sp. IMCC44478]|uniref:hypothetical protein n=1 Tax=Robiginitalea sp. IMCC44478 TaxID=3459122 RepID=UPI0040435EDD
MFTTAIFSQQQTDTLVLALQENGKTTSVKEHKKSSISLETMVGDNKVNYLSILNSRLGNNNKLGYFSVITVATPYDYENGLNELVLSSALTYKLINKLFATAGLQYHFLKGIVPYAGFQFLTANPKWLFVVSPSIAFAENTSLQNIGIVEFKPRITNSLMLYTRVQGIFNINLDNTLHERSLLYLRTGLSFQKTSLGFGFNIDFYGPNKTRQKNFGIFIRHLL